MESEHPSKQVIWAKMDRYPFWPGKIVKLSEVPKAIRTQLTPIPFGYECVYFFGSHNYALIPLNLIITYEEGIEKEYQKKNIYKKGSSSYRQFMQAQNEAEQMIHTGTFLIENVGQSSQEEGSEMSEDDSFSKRDKQNETDNTIEEDQKREMKESKLSRSSNSSSLKAGNSDRDGKETLKNINKEKVNQSTKEAEELPKKLKGNEENKPKESQKIKPRVTGKRPSPNDEDVSLVETTREVQRSSHMPIEALPAKEELNSQQSNKRNKGTDIISAVSNIGINHKKDLPVSSNEMDIFKEEDTLFRSPMESALQMNDTDFSSETKSRQSSKKLTATQLVIVIRNITKHPIAKFCNFLIRSHSQGQCWAKANISHPSKMKIVLHEGEHASGVVNYLLELASFVACSSYLHEEETLITHSFSTLVSIPVSVGVEIDLQVKVLQFADSILSLEGLVFIGGDRSKIAVKCMMIKRIILEPNQSLVPSNVNSITISSPSLTVPSSPAHTI